MKSLPETRASGPLVTLLRRADRRRRTRMALAAASRALWPGLVAATVFAAAWRVAGGTALGAAVAVSVLLPAILGFATGLRGRDLLAAASELDRRSDLEAALATGFEVGTGRISGQLAGAALAEAELAAARVRCEGVPVAPARARYLALPAAVLAGVLLLPGGPERRGGGRVLVPIDNAAAGRNADPAGLSADEAAALAARAGDRDERTRAPGDDPGDRDELTDVASVPPPPPRARGRARRDGGARGGGPIDPDAAGARGGAASGEAGDGAGGLGRAGAGPVDLAESGFIRERFPEYEDIVRRYFAGPGT